MDNHTGYTNPKLMPAANVLGIYTPRFFRLFLLLAGLLVAPKLKAQSQYTYNLEQCVQFALNNSNTLIEKRIDATIADKQVNAYLSAGFPQVGINANVSNYLKSPVAVVDASFFGGPAGQTAEIVLVQPWSATVSGSINQLVFDGTFFVGLNAAKVFADLSYKQADFAEIDIVANVTKAYYAVIVNERRLGILDASIANLQELYNTTKGLNEAGFVEGIDVTRIEVALNNLKTQKQTTEKFIDLSYQLLKFQMGMDVKANLKVVYEGDIENFDEGVLEMLSDVKHENRMEFTLLDVQKKLQGYSIKRYQAEYYPSIGLYLNGTVQALRPEFDFFDTKKRWFPIAEAGLRIQWTIFNGLRTQNMVQIEKLKLLQVENKISQMHKAVDFEFDNARTRLITALQSAEVQQNNLKLAEEVLKVTKIKFEEGVGSNIELINAQTSVNEAQNGYINALYDAYSARVDLLKASGKLHPKK